MSNVSELHARFPNVNVALVHWPVLDRAGDQVCTNVTNFDIHDIARASRTFGINKYFIVNKMQTQLMFVERIIDHWKTGYGKKFNPMRNSALQHVRTVETLKDAIDEVGGEPIVVATAARKMQHMGPIGFRQLKGRLEKEPCTPVLLVFGTGFGLGEDALKDCQFLLEPIYGGSEDEYNHLSVRSAVSICLDRLLASW